MMADPLFDQIQTFMTTTKLDVRSEINFCYVCLNVFAERGVEPNDIALPIPAGSLCFMRRVFQLMAEVAVT